MFILQKGRAKYHPYHSYQRNKSRGCHQCELSWFRWQQRIRHADSGRREAGANPYHVVVTSLSPFSHFSFQVEACLRACPSPRGSRRYDGRDETSITSFAPSFN